jgi:glycosyltransferase involved in cell wall biosynthesis
MKILMVCPRFSTPHGGGGYVIAKSLIKALEKRGHNIGVFTSDYEFDVHEAYKGLNDPSKRTWLMPFKTLFTISSLHITTPSFNWRKGVFTEDVDLIHMQGCRTWQNVIAYEQAKKYKIPYIVDAHGFPVEGNLLKRIFSWAFDLVFANKIVCGAEYCIAETETGKKEYLRAGVKEDKIKIIPCPYDLSIFDDLPTKGIFKDKWDIPLNSQIVGFLGGLDRIKGLDYLVQAFAKLDANKSVVLVLAGTDMGFQKELEELACKLGIDSKISYTGYIAGRDKLEFLVDCDVCVFPSRAEQGLCFAALEATMCGVPIIVMDGTGSAEDLRKWEFGYITKKGDIDDLVKRIELELICVIENQYNVSRGQDYIRKNLSITEKVKDYERVYNDVKGVYFDICL